MLLEIFFFFLNLHVIVFTKEACPNVPFSLHHPLQGSDGISCYDLYILKSMERDSTDCSGFNMYKLRGTNEALDSEVCLRLQRHLLPLLSNVRLVDVPTVRSAHVKTRVPCALRRCVAKVFKGK